MLIPAKRLEKGRDEVYARLGLRVLFGKIVVPVGVKFADQAFELFPKVFQ